MKCVLTALAVVLGCAALIPNADAGASKAKSAFPYHGILARNVFNLKDPPPPRPIPKPVVVVPKIRLTLITTILGDKLAGLTWTVPPTRPGEKPRVESHLLRVGQAEAGAEMLEIDEVKGSVKISYQGQPQTLTFPSAVATRGFAPLASR